MNYAYESSVENFPTKTRSKQSLNIVKPYITKEIKIIMRGKHKRQRLFTKNPSIVMELNTEVLEMW